MKKIAIARTLLLGLGIYMLSGTSQAEFKYSTTDLAFLTPNAWDNWFSINNSGAMVGKVDLKLAVYSNGELKLYQPPSFNHHTTAILSNDGKIVYSQPSDWGVMGRAFIFRNNVAQEIQPFYQHVYNGYTWARAINDAGVIVGQTSSALGYNCSLGDIGCEGREPWALAFIWQNGRMTNLGSLGGNEAKATDINNLGVVVGYAQVSKDGDDWELFRHADGKMTSLGKPGGNFQNAVINDAGQIASGNWLYDRESKTRIGLETEFNYVVDINNAGQILGKSEVTSGDVWLYSNGKTINISAELAADGWDYVNAIDLNDMGQILLSGSKGLRFSHILLTPDQPPILLPVPEPGSYAMMIGGLGVLALWRRRRTALPMA